MKIRTKSILIIALILFGGIETAQAYSPMFGNENWKFYTNGIGTWEEGYADNIIDIIKVGTNQQFYSTGFALEPNTLYELRFQAINVKPRTERFSVVVLRHTYPYTSYLHADVVLPTFVPTYYPADTTPPTEHVFTFKTPARIIGDTRLMFKFDHSQAGDQYIIYRGASIRKV